MSEKKITYHHGIVAMLIEMSAADGNIDKQELLKLVKIVNQGLTGGDIKKAEMLINETYGLWSNFDTLEDRCAFIVSLALQIGDNLKKSDKIFIGKALGAIANADGNVHDNEIGFMQICLGCLDITLDDLQG